MMRKSKGKRRRILAISSGGGHWVQLLRLRPSFEDCRVRYVSVRKAYGADVGGEQFSCIVDATRWDKAKLVIMSLQIVWLLVRTRPHIVISTGAAPGYFALRLGKVFGARTIWLDSIANAGELSLTGLLVRKYADLWLTQWPHLARPSGPYFYGGVL